MKKTYQNYMIAPRENSTWWNVFKDGQFLNTVRDEEAARQVVWNETGKGEYITDEMMTPLIIVDPMGGISPTEMLEMFESIKEEKSDNFHYFSVGYKGSDELNPLYQFEEKDQSRDFTFNLARIDHIDKNNVLHKNIVDIYPPHRNIDFVNNISTCFVAPTRHGKTYRMMQWAEQMVKNKQPFIYLMAGYHEGILSAEKYQNVTRLQKIIYDFKIGESALFAIGKWHHEDIDGNFIKMLPLVTEAVKADYHIFIAESPIMWKVLEYLLGIKYHNFTIAVPSLESIVPYCAAVDFDRIMIGRSIDCNNYDFLPVDKETLDLLKNWGDCAEAFEFLHLVKVSGKLMKKLFYSTSNPLTYEHQDVISNTNSEAIPEDIVSLESMFEYAKSKGGNLFYPTTSIKDFLAYREENAKTIRDNINTIAFMSLPAPKGTNAIEDILLSVEAETGFENFMEGIAEVFNSNGIAPCDEGEMNTEKMESGELEIYQYIAGERHSFIVQIGQWKTKQGKQL